MPTDTLTAPPSTPAGTLDVQTGAPNVSAMPASNRSTPLRGRQTSKPERNQEAKAKLDAIAQEMSAKKLLLGDKSPDDVREREARAELEASAPKPEPQAPAKAKAKADPPPKPKEPTEAEKNAAADKSKKVSAAKRALALDGWEPEDIDALKEEKLLAIGAHRAKNQADVNREFSKLKTSATSPTGARNEDGTFAKPEEQVAPAAAKAETPVAPTKAKASESTGHAKIDAMIDSAAEDIGEPAVKVLKGMASTIMQELRKEFQGQGEIGNAVTTEMLYSSGRELMENEYPDAMAKEPGAFDEVAENFKALIASGRYGRGQISKAWRDAGHMAFGPPDTVRKAQRAMLARQAAADKGKVDSGRDDLGSQTAAPIASQRDALRLAAKMMAENPDSSVDGLRDAITTRLSGGVRRAG